MRRTRRLFLVAIAGILSGVGWLYYVQKANVLRSAPKPPAPLPANVQASWQKWCHYMGDGNKPKAEVCARDMDRVEQPEPRIQLRGVELKLYHKDGAVYDLVRSESAEFDEASGVLFSSGEVEITLAVPENAEAKKGRLLQIRSRAVRFDSASGKAATEAPASFSFELGDGSAVGASYDPATRELELLSNVVLDWRGRGAGKPMRVEAGRMIYKEAESKVYLSPWSKLLRDKLTLEAGDAVVTLDDGSIRFVEAQRARGSDDQPGKRLDFAAAELKMWMDEKSAIEKIAGVGDARLGSITSSGRTLMSSDRVELAFDPSGGESVLRTALATGHGVVDSRPSGARGGRRLASETIELKMRPGGEEIESVVTHSPAELDLLPGKPEESKRHMTAERLWLDYGAKNQLRQARAVQVTTRTERPPRKDRKPQPAAVTSSKDLLARFHPETGDIEQIEQWNDFRYDAGERHATAAKAVLDSGRNLILLDGAARAWDAAGSVSASRIELNQENGDFLATGSVRSTRVPDSKSRGSGAMLSDREPLVAQADRMSSAGENQRIVYEGAANLWQGGNRLQADRVAIDRLGKNLRADGNVFSQFVEQPSAAAAKGKPAAGFLTIRAASLDYSDSERLAWYRGGVRLERSGMDVKSRELRAWLKEETAQGGSRLDRAFADGAVEILQSQPARTRRGSAEHAEYYTAEEKVILKGGHPQLADSLKGTTRGPQLTYWANNDSFQVEGAETQPAVSVIRRK